MGEPERIYESADESRVRKTWRALRSPLNRLHSRLTRIDPHASWSVAMPGMPREVHAWPSCTFRSGGVTRTLVHAQDVRDPDVAARALLWMLDDAGLP